MHSQIRDVIETANLNFLLGSGLSYPYLRTLGKIEALLTKLDEANIQEPQKKLITCSLYKSYFDGVMRSNPKILAGDPAAEPVLSAYREFLRTLNTILLQRKSTILGKEVNLFTTNIDVFLEKAVEALGLECNDGFNGRFEPRFALSNFNKSHFKKSPQYDNVSELPTFNLMKLHGSLTWQLTATEEIVFSANLRHIKKLEAITVTAAALLEITDGTSLEMLITGCDGKTVDASVNSFLEAYNELLIVNPTKAKFKQTLLNQTHYELLRIYSNELEKENTVLFVLGFSFADEHIREITMRVANSNPTLMIFIVAYDSVSATDLRSKFPPTSVINNNVEIIAPTLKSGGQEAFKYNLEAAVQKLLKPVLNPSPSAIPEHLAS